jgi:hypothetical protein
MSYWTDGKELDTSRQGWLESLRRACDWTVDVSMVTSQESPYGEDSSFAHRGEYADWRGSFRGEYAAATRTWDVFCPIWHGGQGVKALVMAAPFLGPQTNAPDCMEAGRRGAAFILRNQVPEGEPEAGLIRAYESGSPSVNTSAIFESLDGLLALRAATGEESYGAAATAALDWAARRLFLPDEGLFRDDFDPKTGNLNPTRFGARSWNVIGRPLIDDGVYLTGARLTGRDDFTDVAVRIADRLLADERPAGNWLAYPPADLDIGVIHPRHAYWWGRPLWMVHRVTGQQKYLDCARRSAEWYEKAMRADGGLFRNTDLDFRTPSFGHATSGIACAAILWIELVREFGDDRFLEPARKALRFCRSMQFTDARDANLQGAILEKVLPPAGSDAPPWYLRDVGTFFYIQAVSLALRDLPEALDQE